MKAKSKKKAVKKTVSKGRSDLTNPGMFQADDRQRLRGQIEIEENRLERFPNRTLVRRYNVEFHCPEFTCLCPKTGFPDFATLRIVYIPDQWCVELKSLKLYVNGYRDKHVFHEDVVNIILDDLVELLDPHFIEVVGDFNVRGNIKTIITAKHEKVKKSK